MGILNTVPIDNRFQITLSNLNLASDQSSASRRVRKRPGTAREVWDYIATSLNATEKAIIRTLSDDNGGTKAIGWTPPGEGSDRAFIIEDYSETAIDAFLFDIRLKLIFMPGVTPP